MNDHLEIQGATGSSYRFRRVDPDKLPATAGNFLCVRMTEHGPQVLGCGAAGTLVQAARSWSEAKALGAEALYIRLNFVGAVRAHEFEDIVNRAAPELIFAER